MPKENRNNYDHRDIRPLNVCLIYIQDYLTFTQVPSVRILLRNYPSNFRDQAPLVFCGTDIDTPIVPTICTY